jgi:phosphoglycerate kinase
MMMRSMRDLDLAGRRVLIREDFNVPLHEGCIRDDTRIRAALPTLKLALDQGAAVMVMAHLGRPQEGSWQADASLQPVADALEKALGQPVPLLRDWIDGVDVAPGQLVVCENVRFLQGESSNDVHLAEKMAALCDVFVMDAFATAHRAHASTVGVTLQAPIACAGPLLEQEYGVLQGVMHQAKKPLCAVVGGSKVSNKIEVLEHLLDHVDALIVGGGIANTFLKAQGHPVGRSLYEEDWVERAKALLVYAASKGVTMPLPVDVAVSTESGESAEATLRAVEDVHDDEAIYDVGPQTSALYASVIQEAQTVLWNGPLGVFEWPAFARGTFALAEAVAQSDAYSIAGGGDTVAALEACGCTDQLSYLSTGGGAFLSVCEGKTLPAVQALAQRADEAGG